MPIRLDPADHVWCSAHGWHDAGACPDYAPTTWCPACGEAPDYCQGHGEIGDPVGAKILAMHDADDHSRCHSMAACDPS